MFSNFVVLKSYYFIITTVTTVTLDNTKIDQFIFFKILEWELQKKAKNVKFGQIRAIYIRN